jgi:hypothetical protein
MRSHLREIEQAGNVGGSMSEARVQTVIVYETLNTPDITSLNPVDPSQSNRWTCTSINDSSVCASDGQPAYVKMVHWTVELRFVVFSNKKEDR